MYAMQGLNYAYFTTQIVCNLVQIISQGTIIYTNSSWAGCAKQLVAANCIGAGLDYISLKIIFQAVT